MAAINLKTLDHQKEGLIFSPEMLSLCLLQDSENLGNLSLNDRIKHLELLVSALENNNISDDCEIDLTSDTGSSSDSDAGSSSSVNSVTRREVTERLEELKSMMENMSSDLLTQIGKGKSLKRVNDDQLNIVARGLKEKENKGLLSDIRKGRSLKHVEAKENTISAAEKAQVDNMTNLDLFARATAKAEAKAKAKNVNDNGVDEGEWSDDEDEKAKFDADIKREVKLARDRNAKEAKDLSEQRAQRERERAKKGKAPLTEAEKSAIERKNKESKLAGEGKIIFEHYRDMFAKVRREALRDTVSYDSDSDDDDDKLTGSEKQSIVTSIIEEYAESEDQLKIVRKKMDSGALCDKKDYQKFLSEIYKDLPSQLAAHRRKDAKKVRPAVPKRETGGPSSAPAAPAQPAPAQPAAPAPAQPAAPAPAQPAAPAPAQPAAPAPTQPAAPAQGAAIVPALGNLTNAEALDLARQNRCGEVINRCGNKKVLVAMYDQLYIDLTTPQRKEFRNAIKRKQ